MADWLMKTEPEAYSFEQLQKDGKTVWDGVRNFQARNNLKLMKVDDRVFIYHSMSDKAVVGIAKVSKAHYPDPTDNEKGQWVVVDIKPVKKLKSPITLEMIKEDAKLSKMPLVKQSRLSVMPITKAEGDRLEKLGG